MEISEPEGPTGGTGVEAATLEPMPEVEEAFEEIEVDAPLVGIIMGSKNDKPTMQPAGEALHDADIRYEVRVMSAHRDPEQVREYCHAARMRGLRVIIAGAGMSAALPDVAAFVDVVAESIGPEGRWIHYGLTSSDVLDTGLALQIEEAGLILLRGATAYR